MPKARKQAPKISGNIAPVLEPRKGAAVSPDAGLRGGITVVVDGDPLSEEEARYRERALKHEYRFDRDFPHEYKKAKELIVRYNSDISDDELRFRLGEIVYLHRKCHNDLDYKSKLKECINNAKTASDLADKIWEDIVKADHEYRDVVLSITRRLFSDKFGGDLAGFTGKKGQELGPLTVAGHILRTYHLALELGNRYLYDSPSLTRPKTPYMLEAFKLIELWFFLTGERALYPKGKAKGKGKESEAKQDSTEFVRLCIKMIDPNSELSKVHTSIKRARETRQAYMKVLLGDESELPSELLEVIRSQSK
jgi:hypothetical protein